MPQRLAGPSRLRPYSPSKVVSSASKTLDFIDSKSPLKPDRAWRQIAGPKLTPSQLHCASSAPTRVVNERLGSPGRLHASRAQPRRVQTVTWISRFLETPRCGKLSVIRSPYLPFTAFSGSSSSWRPVVLCASLPSSYRLAFFLGVFDLPDVCFSVTGFIGTAGAGAFGRAGNCPVHSGDSRRAMLLAA